MNELALFAGAGGGLLGSHLLGWKTVCAVEWADYPRRVLLARQRDGILPKFPIWDDVQTFDGVPWRGIVDVVSGGFPCQDISCAGKGAGIDGERSGMWAHMARIIGEVRPQFALVENSPMLTSRGLGRVLGDLAELGYNARWGVLGARDAGAPHRRNRIWIVAHTERFFGNGGGHFGRIGFFGEKISKPGDRCRKKDNCSPWANRIGDIPESTMVGVADGMANRVVRFKAIGNGQVPSVATLAFKTLSGK